MSQPTRLISLLIIACVLLGASALLIAQSGFHDVIAHADLAIVPGNTVESNGLPSARLKARLDKVVQLYKSGVFNLVFVSGGLGKEGFNEARVMGDYLATQGVPASAILVDERGNTTYLTAQHAAELMDGQHLKSALVVSQFFHILRTCIALQRFGVPVVYHAHADFFEARDVYSTLREIPAFYFYAVRHYKNK